MNKLPELRAAQFIIGGNYRKGVRMQKSSWRSSNSLATDEMEICVVVKGMLLRQYVIQCSQTVGATIEKYPHLQGLCLDERPHSSNKVKVDVHLGGK